MAALSMRALEARDLPAALALCRDAGWNQTADDWRLFLRLAPTTCRAGCLDGRLVGTVTVFPYGAFAWIGMVLVDRSSRGQGIGTALLHEALDLIGPEGTARLDATPLGRPLYERLGFRADCDLTRLQCDSFRPGPDREPPRSIVPIVRPMRADDLGDVARLDAEVFGADRTQLLSHCFEIAPHLAWVAESDRSPAGYVLGRSGHDFDHLGPLAASGPAEAAMLTAAALDKVSRRAVIDVPLERETFREWLMCSGFQPQRSFTRMTRGPLAHAARRNALFAALGPEFG
jgi:ribosomal protein S18 acetylase RimI-like enzyme